MAALVVCAAAYGLAVWAVRLRPGWPALVLAGAALAAYLAGRRFDEPPVTGPAGLAGVLERLERAGFHVFAEVSLGYARFPYLVVGPPGLFVLAPVGDEREIEQAAERLADGAVRLADRLGSVVDPVVVSGGVPELPVSAGVPVVPVRFLEEWLLRRRPRWTRARVETVRTTTAEILGLGASSVG